MQTVLAFLFLTFVSFRAQAQLPELPPNACYEGCTQNMTEILQGFENNPHIPDMTPGVYSGSCYHLSESYDPNHEHFSVVMIDESQGQPYFSTIFSFFAENNEFATWSLDEARKNMNSYWKENGKMNLTSNAARIDVLHEDGSPAYLYWLRQNPETKTLYYITYAGGIYLKSFCKLTKNL